jgi:anti-sigma regulatory factor (Ser/Thr protein kinase)
MVAPRRTTERAGGSSAGFHIELEHSVEAPAIARAAATGLCQELGLSPSLRDTCQLLVSELVSNAVRHSGGPPDAPILLTATTAPDTLRIAVTDAGDGFTHDRTAPTPGHGYGLYLVEKAARSWGIDRVGGTRVWFELPRGS